MGKKTITKKEEGLQKTGTTEIGGGGVVGTELLKWGNNILKQRPLKYRKPYSLYRRKGPRGTWKMSTETLGKPSKTILGS